MAKAGKARILSLPRNGDNGDGGNHVDKYVTQEELSHAVDILSAQMKLSDQKNQSNFEALPDKLELALHKHDEKQRTAHNETLKFLIGTIAIGGISLIVTIISLFL